MWSGGRRGISGEVWGSEMPGPRLRGGANGEEAGGSEGRYHATGLADVSVPISQMEKLSPEAFLTCPTEASRLPGSPGCLPDGIRTPGRPLRFPGCGTCTEAGSACTCSAHPLVCTTTVVQNLMTVGVSCGFCNQFSQPGRFKQQNFTLS